jgi:hypothetical protein
MPSIHVPAPLAGEATAVSTAREFKRNLRYMSTDAAVTYSGVTVQRLYKGYRLIDGSGKVHTFTGKRIETQYFKLIKHLTETNIISGQ